MSAKKPKPIVEIDREKDGRWIVEIRGVPNGIMAYGSVPAEAYNKAMIIMAEALNVAFYEEWARRGKPKQARRARRKP